jgi:hypothetical protein
MRCRGSWLPDRSGHLQPGTIYDGTGYLTERRRFAVASQMEPNMRKIALIFSAMIIAGVPMAGTEVNAQSRTEPTPGSTAIDFYSTQQRSYLRSYVVRRTIPSVEYSGQLEVGARLPDSYTYYDVEGDPTVTRYRYGRFNNRYVVIDQSGRVVDVIE